MRTSKIWTVLKPSACVPAVWFALIPRANCIPAVDPRWDLHSAHIWLLSMACAWKSWCVEGEVPAGDHNSAGPMLSQSGCWEHIVTGMCRLFRPHVPQWLQRAIPAKISDIPMGVYRRGSCSEHTSCESPASSPWEDPSQIKYHFCWGHYRQCLMSPCPLSSDLLELREQSHREQEATDGFTCFALRLVLARYTSLSTPHIMYMILT